MDAVEGFEDPKSILIGIGMWLGTIMWFNVCLHHLAEIQQKGVEHRQANFPIWRRLPKAAAGAQDRRPTSRVNTMLASPCCSAWRCAATRISSPDRLRKVVVWLPGSRRAAFFLCPIFFDRCANSIKLLTTPPCAPTTRTALGERLRGRLRCTPYLALYAFNRELAKIAEMVSEPTLGLIRLQWWREAEHGNSLTSSRRCHEVVLAFADTIRTIGLPRELVESLIDAREADLELGARRSRRVGSLCRRHGRRACAGRMPFLGGGGVCDYSCPRSRDRVWLDRESAACRIGVAPPSGFAQR